jgi:SIR2-like domain
MAARATNTKVLVLPADPSTQVQLRLGREIGEIETRLQQAPLRDQYTVIHKSATRTGDLGRLMLSERPAVVHFCGYGGGPGGLLAEDESGIAQTVPNAPLSSLFELFKNEVQCVVLNSCHSASQATEIARHIPYVIGVKQEIGDAAGLHFSVGFYEALFAGESFERAFESGCNAIALEDLPTELRNLIPENAEIRQGLPEPLRPALLTRAEVVSRSHSNHAGPGEQPFHIPQKAQAMTGLQDKQWKRLLSRICEGLCTPFLGAGVCHGTLPLGGEVAQRLAEKYRYPFEDRRDLARVAQFVAVQEDPRTPKEDVVELLRSAGRPDFRDAAEPHGVLAELPFPVYLTTNYDDFMVAALTQRLKRPYRELCRWNDLVRDEPSVFDLPSNYQPHPATPLVFHLHGHTRPESLVLTEDDYLRFLARMAADETLLPEPVKKALRLPALLFIGYSLADWNLRVLLQSLRPTRETLSIVVMPAPKGPGPVQEEAQRYLERYYEQMGLHVYWATAREFCGELRRRWRDQYPSG